MRLQSVLSWIAGAPALKNTNGNGGPILGRTPSIRSLFTFGDSYSTTGFNASFTQPSPGNAMGNPPLGTGTAADGINWVGYLTTTYNDTLVLNYNPAVYGATIDNDIVANIPEDLVYQVEEVFEPNYCGSGSGPNSRNTRTETKTRTRTGQEWNPDSTLFSLWIGINDIYFLSLRPDPYQDMHCAIVRYFELINKLHTCGARNFLIFNVPPCDRSPHVLAYEPKAREEYNEVTVEYNAQLSNAIDAWSEDHPDSSVVAYDSWSFFTEVLDHPEVYGFTDGTSIGSGEKYVWWDDFHPTSAFHRFLAQDVGKFLGWTDE